MLRRVVATSLRSSWKRGNSRWYAAATSQQKKRALDKQQLEGTTTTTTPPPPVSKAPASDSNNMVPLAVAGMAGAAGLAYYFKDSLVAERPKAVEPVKKVEKEEPKKEEPKEEEPPPVVSSKDNGNVAQEEPTIVEEPEDVVVEVSGHRVLQIQVPEGPREVEPVAGVEHPTEGNRVPVQFVTDQEELVREELVELRSRNEEETSETLQRAQEELKKTVDETMYHDVDDLTLPQLKARVIRLAKELEDRTKWEAVRLKEFLAMKEKETASQYMELMQKQRLEFEDLLAQRMRERETELVRQTNSALQEKDDSVKALIEAAVEAEKLDLKEEQKVFEEVKTKELQNKYEGMYLGKLAEEKELFNEELEKNVSLLDGLAKKVKQLEAALKASRTYESGSLRAHRLSAAALALAEKMESNKGAAAEFAALKVAADGNGVIASVLNTLPESINTGVPTLSELQARFESVHKKSRVAALVPEGRAGLDGQLMGMVFSTLKSAPSHEDPAPEDDKDASDYILARARRHVQLGELEDALAQLDKLKGQAAFTIRDWKKDAADRLALDRGLKVIKLECAALSKSMESGANSSK